MKVKCLSAELSDEQRKKLNLWSRHRYLNVIRPGRVYTVLGITFVRDSSVYGNGPAFDIRNDDGDCVGVPSAQFEVIDPRASRYWIARLKDVDAFTLWPEPFYKEYFHDILSDGAPEYVAEFERVCTLLDNEFDDESSSKR